MNRRVLALILLCGALALPALPVHADATDDLFEAVKNGTASEVKAALAAGADPGAARRGGMTPLHWAAARHSDPSVIKALIEAGADPGARLDNGIGWPGGMSTPLHVAVLSGAVLSNANPSVIKALIEGGADPDARDEHGWTPLHVAVLSKANPSVITALIEGGANPDARGEYGDTPLHRVAARIWIDTGADLSVFGDTGADLSVILALLRAGADPGARNEHGKTPFDYVKDNEALKGTGVYRLLNPAAGAGAAAWAPAWAVRAAWARDRPGPCAKARGFSMAPFVGFALLVEDAGPVLVGADHGADAVPYADGDDGGGDGGNDGSGGADDGGVDHGGEAVRLSQSYVDNMTFGARSTSPADDKRVS